MIQITAKPEQLSEKLFPWIFQTSPYAIVISRLKDGVILDANASAEKLFGYSKKEGIGKTAAQIGFFRDEKFREIIISEIASNGCVRDLILPIITSAGEHKTINISIEPIEIDGEGFLAAWAKDVTWKIKTETALMMSEQRLRNTLDNMMEGCAIVDFNWQYLYVNNINAAHAHLSTEEMIGRSMLELIPGVIDTPFYKAYKACFEERISKRLEAEFTFADGSSAWYEVHAQPIEEGMFIFSWDITSKKKTEEKMKKELQIKETLLRELHHRVKNNMQIVSSLLNLKGSTHPDEHVQRVFLQMKQRIRTLALVHEQLYSSHDLSRINLKKYIEELMASLTGNNSCLMNGVTVNLLLDDTDVLIDTALPCGMLITEVIQNSLMHAFPDGKCGEIKVMLQNCEDGSLCLELSDNGIGIPQEIPSDEKKFGMQLIYAVANQLEAEVQLYTEDGVQWLFHFRNEKYSERISKSL